MSLKFIIIIIIEELLKSLVGVVASHPVFFTHTYVRALGLYITQYGSTVYIGIAMVYPH